MDLHRFPDGEEPRHASRDLEARDVIMLANLRDPDRIALQLRFRGDTARDCGARRVGLIAPYLAYMRQDRRFAPGQAVSAPLFARFLEESFDWLVTADPHLHRIASLTDCSPIPGNRVVSAPLLADWITANVPDAVLLGPDSESQQWVAESRALAGRPYEVLHKVRLGRPQRRDQLAATPRCGGAHRSSSTISPLPGGRWCGSLKQVVKTGARPPICVIIHAVFRGRCL